MAAAYLTIDDAPTPALPEKLVVLQSADVPALFFCEGRRLTDYQQNARRAIEAGYHVGNHAYSHTPASDLSVEAFRDEIERTEELIDECYRAASVERPARLFRFPYGDDGGDRREAFQDVLADFDFLPPNRDRLWYPWYADEYGENRDWRWTIDINDWTVATAEGLEGQIDAIADRLSHPSPDIVLFHDHGNDPALVAACLELFRDRGVTFADPLALIE